MDKRALYLADSELIHFGVLGMKWGHRKQYKESNNNKKINLKNLYKEKLDKARSNSAMSKLTKEEKNEWRRISNDLKKYESDLQKRGINPHQFYESNHKKSNPLYKEHQKYKQMIKENGKYSSKAFLTNKEIDSITKKYEKQFSKKYGEKELKKVKSGLKNDEIILKVVSGSLVIGGALAVYGTCKLGAKGLEMIGKKGYDAYNLVKNLKI